MASMTTDNINELIELPMMKRTEGLMTCSGKHALDHMLSIACSKYHVLARGGGGGGGGGV